MRFKIQIQFARGQTVVSRYDWNGLFSGEKETTSGFLRRTSNKAAGYIMYKCKKMKK